MKTMFEYTFQFSDKHWEKHDKAIVSIPLERFEQLVTATELLAAGRRLNVEQKRNWALIAGSANAMLAAEYKKILQGE